MTDHQTQGSLGQAIGDPVANAETMYDAVVTDAVGANIAADIITVDTVADGIKSKTDDLRFTTALQVDSNFFSVDNNASAADTMRRYFGDACVRGTAESGSTTTMIDTAVTDTNTACIG